MYVSLSQTYKDNEQYDLSLEFFRKELELWENNPVEVSLYTCHENYSCYVVDLLIIKHFTDAMIWSNLFDLYALCFITLNVAGDI